MKVVFVAALTAAVDMARGIDRHIGAMSDSDSVIRVDDAAICE